MYAVVRETSYAPSEPLQELPGFKRFQDAHASRPGYRGTIVTHVGSGRYVTVTLWESADEMNEAREALGPAVRNELEPAMAAPSKLRGTGEVVFTDIC